nr:retrovirus-related Pol polyprotein from transposon TNT 1-94 [Tanacetum cinerariifolium]
GEIFVAGEWVAEEFISVNCQKRDTAVVFLKCTNTKLAEILTFGGSTEVENWLLCCDLGIKTGTWLFGCDLGIKTGSWLFGCELRTEIENWLFGCELGMVIGNRDKLVCWSSKKQNCVSISIAESEYVAVSGCCAQVLWMRTQLTDYGFFYDKVPVYCDSKSAIAISCNPYPVIHHPPQETSEEILQARENLMQSIQTFLRKFNLISFREMPKVLTQAWDKFFEIQHAQPEDIHEFLRKLLEDLQIINEELVEYINSPSWNRSRKLFKYGDEHLSTILKTESDEVIKSSVKDLVPITSESEGILDNMCNVPFSDKNHFDAESDFIESLLTRDTSIVYSSKIDSLLEEFASELIHIDLIPPRINETNSNPKDDIRFIEQLLYNDTSSEDDSFKDIDCVEAPPSYSELVSLEEVKDDILRSKLLNIHLLIAKIESLNINPTLDCMLKSSSSSFLSYTDNSSPEFNTFIYQIQETSSGSTTTHANYSLPEYDLFLFEIEPDQGELTRDVMNDISNNSTNDPLMEEIDLFLASNNSIPSGIKNVDSDSEGDIFRIA